MYLEPAWLVNLSKNKICRPRQKVICKRPSAWKVWAAKTLSRSQEAVCRKHRCTICCVGKELAEAAGCTAARRNARAGDSFSAGAVNALTVTWSSTRQGGYARLSDFSPWRANLLLYPAVLRCPYVGHMLYLGGNQQQVHRASGNGWCLDAHCVPAYLVLAGAY